MSADGSIENGNYNDLISGLTATVTGHVYTNRREGLNAIYITGDDNYIEWPIDIGPSNMPQMTLEILVWLPSVANNRGWIFGDQNGGKYFFRNLLF